MRERLYLLSIICLVAFIWGCGGDGDDPDVKLLPSVVDVNVKEGMVYPDNMYFVVNFNKEMKSVKIDISGYEFAKTVFGPTNKKATWQWLPHDILCGGKTIAVKDPISPGMHTLTVTGKDIYGNELEGFTPINFKVVPPD
ncbi:MAG: hypothetical protein QG641_1617 [Candidatus Poribacteria bacterium]|nr:hypothetical protein [Candidatus Poribacteria bacterium]